MRGKLTKFIGKDKSIINFMLKKINKNKIYTYFFVIISLMAFLALSGFYLMIYFSNLHDRVVIANNNIVDNKKYSKKISGGKGSLFESLWNRDW